MALKGGRGTYRIDERTGPSASSFVLLFICKLIASRLAMLDSGDEGERTRRTKNWIPRAKRQRETAGEEEGSRGMGGADGQRHRDQVR